MEMYIARKDKHLGLWLSVYSLMCNHLCLLQTCRVSPYRDKLHLFSSSNEDLIPRANHTTVDCIPAAAMSFLKIGSLGSSSSSRTHSAANSDSESELDEAAKRGRRDKRRSITSFLLGKGYSKGKSASPPSRIQRKRRPSGEEGRSRSPSADRGVPIDDSEADLTDKEGVKEGVRSSVVPDNAFTDDEEEDSDDQGQGGQLDQSSSSEEEDEWAPVNAKAVAQVQAKMSDPQVQSKMKEPTPAPPAAAPVDDDDDDGWDPVPSAKVADTPAQDGVKSVATPAEVKKAKEDGYEEIDMAKELQLYRNTEVRSPALSYVS